MTVRRVMKDRWYVWVKQLCLQWQVSWNPNWARTRAFYQRDITGVDLLIARQFAWVHDTATLCPMLRNESSFVTGLAHLHDWNMCSALLIPLRGRANSTSQSTINVKIVLISAMPFGTSPMFSATGVTCSTFATNPVIVAQSQSQQCYARSIRQLDQVVVGSPEEEGELLRPCTRNELSDNCNNNDHDNARAQTCFAITSRSCSVFDINITLNFLPQITFFWVAGPCNTPGTATHGLPSYCSTITVSLTADHVSHFPFASSIVNQHHKSLWASTTLQSSCSESDASRF